MGLLLPKKTAARSRNVLSKRVRLVTTGTTNTTRHDEDAKAIRRMGDPIEVRLIPRMLGCLLPMPDGHFLSRLSYAVKFRQNSD